MYCDQPHKSCPVVSCYSNIYVGKIADVSTTVTVHIENMATGRVQMEDVTSDADGIILLIVKRWHLQKVFNGLRNV